MQKKHIITLSTRQRSYLEDITTKGKHNARVIKRAQILLKSFEGLKDTDIVYHVGISVRTVERVRSRFTESLERALFDAPRSGAPLKLTVTPEAHLVATACTDPPEDAEHWTLELLQQFIVESGQVETISLMTLWRHLTERGIKPWLQKMWCVPKLTKKFIVRMEDILRLYRRRYNLKQPVVCFDEKTTQILSDTRQALPLYPGKARRADYEYKRLGTRNIFVVVEPKGGKRQVKVTKRRCKKDFAYAIKQLIIDQYPEADKIHVVMDNLNTHNKSSLVEAFGQQKADDLWDRIELHYTPAHASWLNMAEIEIGILSRQVLKRRRDSIEEMIRAVATWRRNRNRKKATIDWKFTTKDARKKFKYTRQN